MGKQEQQRLLLRCHDWEKLNGYSWYSLNPDEDASEKPIKLYPFTKGPFPNDPEAPQYNFSSVVLGSKLYVMGGVAEAADGIYELSNSVYSYDLNLLLDAESGEPKLLDADESKQSCMGKWKKRNPMLSPRRRPFLIPFATSDEILVIGRVGPDIFQIPLPFVELYHESVGSASSGHFELASYAVVPLYGGTIQEDDKEAYIMWTDSYAVYSFNPRTLAVNVKEVRLGDELPLFDDGEWLAVGNLFYALRGPEVSDDDRLVKAYDWTTHSWLPDSLVRLEARKDRKYFIVELHGYSFGIVCCKFDDSPLCEVSISGYNHTPGENTPLQPSLASPTFLVAASPDRCLTLKISDCGKSSHVEHEDIW